MRFPLSLIGLLVLAPLQAQTPVATQLVASGFNRPLCIAHAPGDPTRVFVVEKPGVIRIVKDGAVLPTPFLDITGLVNSSTIEFGLLSLCFDPNHATNGRFYVHYITGPNGDSRIARFTLTANPDVADPASVTTVLFLPQTTPHHRGGWLGFSGEGHLYVALGDGGPQEDPFHHAQDLALLHGKILRLDVRGDDFPGDPDRNYRVPASNPFVGQAGIRPEIWASGLRNPWRCSFDRETNDFWIGDVGEYEREELNVQLPGVGGQNYGWSCIEGTVCSPYGGCTCHAPTLTSPIHDYDHDIGRAVTCGYVYRGSAIPGLVGRFVYGDYQSGRFWSLRWDGTSVTEFADRTAQMNPPGSATIDHPASFGEDAQGEIYVCDYFNGTLFKIVPSTDAAAPTATILLPTDQSTWSTSSATLALSGSAADDVEVIRVEWSNAPGGSGTATGTTTWSVPLVTLVPGTNVITMTAFDAVGNSATDVLTVDHFPAPVAFCTGDGAGTPCPCGNVGAPGNGCPNSIHAGGARLAATGFASLSNDTLRLEGSTMPSSSASYFQGTLQTNGGAGAAFGDGKRCAGGSLIRLVGTANVAGASVYPADGDPSISVRGALVGAPQTRTYQVWYRNAASFCAPETFNLTNGLSVLWLN